MAVQPTLGMLPMSFCVARQENVLLVRLPAQVRPCLQEQNHNPAQISRRLAHRR